MQSKVLEMIRRLHPVATNQNLRFWSWFLHVAFLRHRRPGAVVYLECAVAPELEAAVINALAIVPV
jgi:hypothetical protein